MGRLDAVAEVLLSRVMWTAIQTTLLVLLIAVVSRRFKALPANMRCLLWWSVALQVLLGLAGALPVGMSGLGDVDPRQPVLAVLAAAAQSTTASAGFGPTALIPAGHPIMPIRHWPRLVAALWLMMVLLMIGRMVLQAMRMTQVRSRSRPVNDSRIQSRLMVASKLMDVHTPVGLQMSGDVLSPCVIGWWRPVILVPETLDLSEGQWTMVFLHELAHILRRDAYMGWIPALAQCVCPFHPLLQWAIREFSIEREHACDTRVVQCMQGNVSAYAALLLQLGVTEGRGAALNGASPTYLELKRRLSMLNETTRRARAWHWLVLVPLTVACVLPYRLAAADDGWAAAADAQSVTTPPSPGPDSVVSPIHLPFSVASLRRTPALAYFCYDGKAMFTNTGQASSDMLLKLQASSRPFLRFRVNDHDYLTTDRRTVEQFKRSFAPLFALWAERDIQLRKEGVLRAHLVTSPAAIRAGMPARAVDARSQAELAEVAARLDQLTTRERRVFSDANGEGHAVALAAVRAGQAQPVDGLRPPQI